MVEGCIKKIQFFNLSIGDGMTYAKFQDSLAVSITNLLTFIYNRIYAKIKFRLFHEEK